MKKWLPWLALVVCLVAGLFLYFHNQYQSQETGNTFIYNSVTQRWNKANREDPLGEDREAITANLAGKDDINNPSILRGYFDSYDEKDQILTVKVVLSFTQNALFQEKQVKLFSGQSIYCTPAIYVDPNTGIAYNTKDIVIPVAEGETLQFHNEQLISFTDFIEQSTDRTYLYLQLTANYNDNATNYVQKILVVGLCE